jgi:hypothetical protein
MTTSSEKRAARERSVRTGEPYQTALWRNRDLGRFTTFMTDWEAKGFRVLTDNDKRALWRGESVAIDPEQHWAFKYMFDMIEACIHEQLDQVEQAELANAVPWIFGPEHIKDFTDPFGILDPPRDSSSSFSQTELEVAKTR